MSEASLREQRFLVAGCTRCQSRVYLVNRNVPVQIGDRFYVTYQVQCSNPACNKQMYRDLREIDDSLESRRLLITTDFTESDKPKGPMNTMNEGQTFTDFEEFYRCLCVACGGKTAIIGRQCIVTINGKDFDRWTVQCARCSREWFRELPVKPLPAPDRITRFKKFVVDSFIWFFIFAFVFVLSIFIGFVCYSEFVGEAVGCGLMSYILGLHCGARWFSPQEKL